MDSLFDTSFTCHQPFRKFEPLIRFDIDGNPQPRKPLQNVPSLPQQESKAALPAKTSEPKERPITNANQTKPIEDLKRKVSDMPPFGTEPKKKQQKQGSITAFFKKKEP